MNVLLAVNGTLMRGLELNANLLEAGATFVREARTAPVYRLWSIDDRHPAMIRVSEGGADATVGGAAIALEVWSVPPEGLAAILLKEPPGLCIGKVRLEDGSETLGVLGEPALCEGQREITRYGGWRAYVASRQR
jgi:hypothetical protein